jgi:glycosyltransferase involved in cell wall biosynthesis
MFKAVHQLLPALTSGDAIGNQALFLQQLLRRRGYTSHIFAGSWDVASQAHCQPYRQYAQVSHANNLLILHYAVGGEVNTFAQSLPDRKLMVYHNVTPGHFFRGFNDDVARLCDEARASLHQFASNMSIVADSPYNADEMRAMGFEVLGIVPPVVDFDRLTHLLGSDDAQKARVQFAKPNANCLDWLFVGRMAPNKCVHDIIKAFYYFHKFVQPNSRLLLMGGNGGVEAYTDGLRQLVASLSLEDAVVFAGHQPDGALAAFYEMADVYVSMSEHEGFCVPVLEAMQFGLPVLAYNSTNLPHTLGNAGVLLNRKDPKLVAEMAYEMCCNQPLRQKIIARQRARLSAFSPDITQQSFFDCLAKLN